MESHGWTMRGPLNTDNIRAQDGTLAASIDDGTGNVTFQNDVEVSNDLDVDRDATIFRNLEVQGPLSTFIQSISVGVNAVIGQNLDVGQDLDVGRDTDITRDLAVGRNAAVVTDLTVGNRVETTNLRVTGTSPAAGKVLVSGDVIGNLSYQYASVPPGQSILFNTNDTVLGYTILDVSDDEIVYVTKGTVLGGQAGGATKPGSTWTQPTHIHGLGSITVPAHNHKWMDYQGKGSCWSWASNGTTQLNLRSAYGITGHTTAGFFVQATSCNANNPAGDFWTANSGATTGDAGDTDAGGTVNTWRPKGRNFTLQQKN